MESNNSTGIQAQNSMIFFSGSTTIAHNSAMIGGGLNLFNTKMLLAPNTDLIITNNSAEKTGGGIQISDPPICVPIAIKSFCQVSSDADPDTVIFIVTNNHAQGRVERIFLEAVFTTKYSVFQTTQEILTHQSHKLWWLSLFR